MNEMVAFVEARLAEDEAWALAASQPYKYAVEGASVPAGGVHWTWVVGENWEPVKVDPVADEYVGGPDSAHVNLASVEEWPHRPWVMSDGSTLPSDRMMRATVANSMEEVSAAAGGHIVRHDPARVLREVAFKRALMREYIGCELADDPATIDGVPGEMLRALAAVWSGHPDYRAA